MFALLMEPYAMIQMFTLLQLHTVAYAENFHGGFGSRSYGGYLYLVCTVYDVTI